MSSRRSRVIKASRWDRDREESSHAADELRPPRKGPAGLIFMCNSKTKRDCFHYKVLGLPLAKRDLVEQVVPGTFLFLFDFDVKELYGIYEASSQGGLNLEPKAFEGQGSYPAQVRFDIHRECLPLSEDIFRDAIKENYYSRNKFHFELTSGQVSKLIQLFCPVEPPRKRLHVSTAAVQEAEGSRHGLPEGTISASVGLERFHRDPQNRLPTQALRIEERLPRHDPLVRLEPRPMIVDAPRLPQIRVLDERSDQKGLLTQGRLDEVDQLALKYLQQGNPTVGSALDAYRRNNVLPVVEGGPRSITSLQQDAILRARALEAERLRRAASDRTILREQGSFSGPNLTVSSLAAIRSQQVAVSGSLRQSAGHREARRRQ